MRVHLQTLGCRLNEAELEGWARDFVALGHRLVEAPEQADLLVINTCAVTGEAVRKSRKLLNRARRINPRARLVVSGCYAALHPGETAQFDGVDLVVPNADKERLVEIASRELNLHVLPESAAEPDQHPLFAQGRQRAFIKVQDGCRHQCGFCVVTLARGEERSRPVDAVVEEVLRHRAQGVREAVLAGVHLGGYGHDNGSDLAKLVAAILDRTDLPRLRLGAVEPWDLPEGFWELFSAHPRLMPHLHLPVQSGSDAILRRMARRCKRAEFLELVARARDAHPDFNLGSDLIVGFPGEGEAEWRETLELVEEAGFGHLHIFAFSPRPGTRAADLPDQVPREAIRERSRQLHELGERTKREVLRRFLGRRFPVLIERGEEAPSGGSGLQPRPAEPVPGDVIAAASRSRDGAAPSSIAVALEWSRGGDPLHRSASSPFRPLPASWRGYTPNFLRVDLEGPVEANPESLILEAELIRLNDAGDGLVGRLV